MYGQHYESCITIKLTLAKTCRHEGLFDESLQLARACLQSLGHVLGSTQLLGIETLVENASCQQCLSLYDNALEQYCDACDSIARSLGLHHPVFVSALCKRAECLAEVGKYDEAIGHLDAAVRRHEMASDDSMGAIADLLSTRALVYFENSQYDLCLQDLERSFTILRKQVADDNT